jgi:hypothetical protein
LLVRGVPLTAGPPYRAIRVHSAMDWILSRVLSPPLDCPIWVIGPTPMKFRCPTTASSSQRLSCGVGCLPLSGSAPRLFQPLSGFRTLEFHGLVSCRNRSWTTSYRAFPSRRPCSPSRDQPTPLLSSSGVRVRVACDLITVDFTDAHALDAVAWIPRRL